MTGGTAAWRGAGLPVRVGGFARAGVGDMGAPEPAGTALPSALEQRLAEVGASLIAATGGQALCRLDGHVAPAKELEGRMAALLELRRALRADPDADVRAIADRWRSDLASRRAKGSSAAWLAYLAGGLAELEGITAE